MSSLYIREHLCNATVVKNKSWGSNNKGNARKGTKQTHKILGEADKMMYGRKKYRTLQKMNMNALVWTAVGAH
jgi:hypothetical protein